MILHIFLHKDSDKVFLLWEPDFRVPNTSYLAIYNHPLWSFLGTTREYTCCPANSILEATRMGTKP